MNDKFNDKVKDAFDHLEDDFEPALIWSGINDKMKPKKKRRAFFFWFNGIGLIAALLFASFYFSNRLAVEENRVLNTTDSKKVSNPSIINSAPTQPQTQESSPNIVTSEAIKTTQNFTTNQKSSSKTKRIQSQSQSAPPIGVSRLNATTTIKRDNANFNSSNVVNENTSLSKRKHPENKNVKTVTKPKKGLSIESTLLLWDIQKIGKLELNPITSNYKIASPNINIQPLNHFNKKSNPISFFNTAEIYSGLSKGSKMISTSNVEYADNRNESEVLLEQLNLGVRVQVLNFYDFSFWGGAKFSRITDKWSLDLEYFEDMPITYVDYTVEYPDGSIENHMVTELKEHKVKRNIEQFNSEQILSFPLEVRFGKEIDNWIFSLGAGFELNYLFGAKHTVLGLDNRPLEEQKSSRWIDPALSFGFHTSYTIDPVWSITAGLNYRRISINNSTLISDLTSSYNLYGLEVGVSRKLFL